jgi:hypothetical protein
MPTGKEQAQAERLAQNEANQEAQDEWAEASATERLPEFAGRTKEEIKESKEESDERREAADEDVPDSDPGGADQAKDVDEPKVVGTPKSDKKRSGTTGAKSLGKK